MKVEPPLAGRRMSMKLPLTAHWSAGSSPVQPFLTIMHSSATANELCQGWRFRSGSHGLAVKSPMVT